jgi:hypothetical protein
MGLEGHGDGRAADLARLTPDAVEEFQMAAVQPVEVSERGDRPRPLRARAIGER